MKREPTHYPSVLERLVAALRAELGSAATVRDAWTAGTEEIVLLLDGTRPAKTRLDGDPSERGRSGEAVGGARSAELHLLLLAPEPLFWLRPADRRREVDSGLAEWLRRRIAGQRITGVTTGRSGRILEIVVKPREGGAQSRLVLDPGANTARFFVLDASAKIEQRFPPPLRARPTGRGVPGQTYSEPAAGFREPWTRCAPPPRRTDDDAEGPLWVCCAGRDTVSEDGGRLPLFFLSPRSCGELRTRHAPAHGGATESAALAEGRAPLSAAREAGQLWIQAARHSETVRRLLRLVRAEERHLRRLARSLEGEAAEAGRGAQMRRQAEALLAHAGRIPKGAEQVELDDPASAGEKIRVPLDPTLSFAANADRLFQRARRLERALPLREQKRQQVATLLSALRAARRVLHVDPLAGPGLRPSVADVAQQLTQARSELEEAIAALVAQGRELASGLGRRWQRLGAACRATLVGFTRPIERESYEARQSRAETREGERQHRRPQAKRGAHPRRFRLPGGWTVLVARSRRENDLLTHRIASPRDYWFHAQGVSGSHVILRRGARRDNPSRAVLEMTAAIAAYYSKARTSGMAPVIYTEKRYVRKPRKAPPGLAVCTREKTLMVEPHLPPEATAAEDAN